MPARKTDKPAETVATPDPGTQTATIDHPVGGIAAEDLAVLEQPIDDRMKALLKDHQEMGVRPK